MPVVSFDDLSSDLVIEPYLTVAGNCQTTEWEG
jgi:hypothetical protein